jgi:cysteinyl-tRNA synthetase
VLGLLQDDPRGWLQSEPPRHHEASGALAGQGANVAGLANASSGLDVSAIGAQIAARAAAKATKNFAEADRIRQSLLEQGIVLKDSPAGTTWERS